MLMSTLKSTTDLIAIIITATVMVTSIFVTVYSVMTGIGSDVAAAFLDTFSTVQSVILGYYFGSTLKDKAAI